MRAYRLPLVFRPASAESFQWNSVNTPRCADGSDSVPKIAYLKLEHIKA
jgi:hypothetical protein